MVVIIALVHGLVITAVAFQIYRAQRFHRKVFWPALGLKLIAGICLGLIYTYYYPAADTFGYFHDASRAAGLAKQDFSSYLSFLFDDYAPEQMLMTEPRALFFSRITSVFSLLTGGNYWAIGFYFSFFSFLGSWFLLQVLTRNIPSVSRPAVIAFLFMPSVVFWTSGVLKESLAMTTLFFLAGIFLKIWFRERIRWWQIASALPAIWLLWNLKYYYAGVLLAVTGACLVYSGLFGRRDSVSPIAQALIWMLVLTVPATLITFLHPNFNIDRLLTVVVQNNEVYNTMSSTDSIVRFHNLQATPFSILINAPWALLSGLFRPFVWEVSSFLQLIAATENLLILLFFLTCLTRTNTIAKSPHRLLILALVVYVIVLGVFLTLSAPNLGTLSRYRVGYISFFTFIILCNNPALEYVERSLTRLVRKIAGT